MSNFSNRSDYITLLRAEIDRFISTYREIDQIVVAGRDFDYLTTGAFTPGPSALVNADFVGENADLMAAQFYADLIPLSEILALFTASRRKALSRLST